MPERSKVKTILIAGGAVAVIAAIVVVACSTLAGGVPVNVIVPPSTNVTAGEPAPIEIYLDGKAGGSGQIVYLTYTDDGLLESSQGKATVNANQESVTIILETKEDTEGGTVEISARSKNTDVIKKTSFKIVPKTP